MIKNNTVSHYLRHPKLGVITYTEVFQEDGKYLKCYAKDEEGNNVTDPDIIKE
jgi:hypothetical protein